MLRGGAVGSGASDGFGIRARCRWGSVRSRCRDRRTRDQRVSRTRLRSRLARPQKPRRSRCSCGHRGLRGGSGTRPDGGCCEPPTRGLECGILLRRESRRPSWRQLGSARLGRSRT